MQMTIRAIMLAGLLLSGLGVGHPTLAQKPNNLVLYDQHVAQNSLQTIAPEFAPAGQRPPDHLPLSRRDLLAALCPGLHDHGQQHLQRLAHEGFLAM